MQRLLYIILYIVLAASVSAQEVIDTAQFVAVYDYECRTLNSEVQDIRAHKPLIGATVELLSADSTVLQQKVAKTHWYAENYDWETSEFSFFVPSMGRTETSCPAMLCCTWSIG